MNNTVSTATANVTVPIANGQVEICTSDQQLEELRGEWDALNPDNVFLTWSWLSSWWTMLGQPAGFKLCVLVSRGPDRQLRGIAPFCLDRRSVYGRALRLLGSGSACSDYMSLIPGAADPVELAADIWDALDSPAFRQRLGRFNMLELEGHIQDDVAIRTLVALAENRGFQLDLTPLTSCWRADLSAGWEAYCRQIKKSRRRKINKANRRFEDPRFQFQVIRERRELERSWSVFVDLHQRRRQSLGQAGCFADQRFEAFLREASMQLIDRDRALLAEIRFEGQPLASTLCFGSGRRLSMYQVGHDPRQETLEPGHLVNTFLLQKTADWGFAEYDFLRGDEPYKQNWSQVREPLFRTRLVAPHFAARCRHSVVATGRTVRDWSQNVLTQIANR